MDQNKYKQRYELLAQMSSDMSVKHFPKILELKDSLPKDRWIEFIAEFLIWWEIHGDSDIWFDKKLSWENLEKLLIGFTTIASSHCPTHSLMEVNAHLKEIFAPSNFLRPHWVGDSQLPLFSDLYKSEDLRLYMSTEEYETLNIQNLSDSMDRLGILVALYYSPYDKVNPYTKWKRYSAYEKKKLDIEFMVGVLEMNLHHSRDKKGIESINSLLYWLLSYESNMGLANTPYSMSYTLREIFELWHTAQFLNTIEWMERALVDPVSFHSWKFSGIEDNYAYLHTHFFAYTFKELLSVAYSYIRNEAPHLYEKARSHYTLKMSCQNRLMRSDIEKLNQRKEEWEKVRNSQSLDIAVIHEYTESKTMFHWGAASKLQRYQDDYDCMLSLDTKGKIQYLKEHIFRCPLDKGDAAFDSDVCNVVLRRSSEESFQEMTEEVASERTFNRVVRSICKLLESADNKAIQEEVLDALMSVVHPDKLYINNMPELVDIVDYHARNMRGDFEWRTDIDKYEKLENEEGWSVGKSIEYMTEKFYGIYPDEIYGKVDWTEYPIIEKKFTDRTFLDLANYLSKKVRDWECSIEKMMLLEKIDNQVSKVINWEIRSGCHHSNGSMYITYLEMLWQKERGDAWPEVYNMHSHYYFANQLENLVNVFRYALHNIDNKILEAGKAHKELFGFMEFTEWPFLLQSNQLTHKIENLPEWLKPIERKKW